MRQLATWAEALDSYERRLEELEKWVAEGGRRPEVLPLPSSLGPLPAELEARAAELLRRGRGLEDRLGALREEQGMLMMGRISRGRTAPCYLDRSA
ncbi:MAG: hypothetical protein M0Z87_04510 [Actinomycetota bacterium]|nr:hypothetical protein [Actinomycetota bacterium]